MEPAVQGHGHQRQTLRKLAHVYGLTERGYPSLGHKRLVDYSFWKVAPIYRAAASIKKALDRAPRTALRVQYKTHFDCARNVDTLDYFGWLIPQPFCDGSPSDGEQKRGPISTPRHRLLIFQGPAWNYCPTRGAGMLNPPTRLREPCRRLMSRSWNPCRSATTRL
jgi:hypothetical protein